jgi:hypothetical protein
MTIKYLFFNILYPWIGYNKGPINKRQKILAEERWTYQLIYQRQQSWLRICWRVFLGNPEKIVQWR